MNKSMSLLQGIAEFGKEKKHINELEERLEMMARTPLLNAFKEYNSGFKTIFKFPTINQDYFLFVNSECI